MAQPSLEGVRELLGRPENADANLVPIYVELLADLETPVSAFLKLRRGEHSFLLESVENATTTTRYSFIGTEPDDLVTATGGADPLVELERRMGEFRPVSIPGLDVLPPFTGGAIGYLAYDCVRFFEPRAAANIAAQADALDIPDSVFMLCNSLCVFDHARRVIQLVSHVRVPGRAGAAGAAAAPLDDAALAAAYAEAERDIDVLQSRLGATIVNRAGPAASRLVRVPKGGAGASGGVGGGDSGGGGGGGGAAAAPAQFAGWEESSNVGRDGYKHFVRELKGHIVNGDIIQAVPSHRVSLPMPEGVGSFDVYRQLRAVNPSPYMFYLELGEGFEVVGASPEMLVKVDAHKRVFTHPIAGTRHRGKTEVEDEALAAELLADPKERAEHIMLVDLGRNDIGRVATPGSVTVDSLMKIEKYSHVMHIVSVVSGDLDPSKTVYDAVRSIFPAGTVSGAPKVRAMQIVGGLEKERRGIYAGAAGYVSYSGVVDTAIAIRTIVVRKGQVYIQSGGGIVFDSQEEDEYMETVNKMAGSVRSMQAVRPSALDIVASPDAVSTPTGRKRARK